ISAPAPLQETRDALSAFRGFVRQASSLHGMLGRAAVAIVAPASPFIGLSPPWPTATWVAAVTAVLQVGLYIACYAFLRPIAIGRVRRWLKWALCSLGGSLVVYIIMSVFFTPEAPDFLHREVAGWSYTPDAQVIRTAHPGISDSELIKRFGNEVEKVYESVGLKSMRTIFLFLWLWVFGS